MADLRKRFKEKIISELQNKLSIKNKAGVPALSKIVVNVGIKNAPGDKKSLEAALDTLAQITGQKPKVTAARKSIASFKLRQGDKIGVMITLRNKRMYDFFEKLVDIVLPRLRDFHGVRRESFDGRGNYTLGFNEYSIFPEIDLGRMDQALARQGLEITIATTAKNDEEGFALLSALGMPFRKENK